MRLTGTIRERTRVSGSLGVATITSFGDATALVTDILAPKTAYIATGKVTGTCTYDADTSSGDAVAADIALGKKAWVDGAEVTGSSTKNADTSDATLVANDMLYGVTAYGADGTKLTGTGANWQKVKWLYGTFSGSDISGDIEIYAPSAVLYREIFLNCTGLTGIKLTYSGSMGSTASSIFRGCASLVTIDCELNCTLVSSLASAFQYCGALQTVRFTASSVGTNFSFANSPLLTTTTLLSIANGLDASNVATLTMHADSKTNMDNINVDVVDGLAVLGTIKTLTQFITTDKGWTIA